MNCEATATVSRAALTAPVRPQVEWIGSALDDLRAMPEEVQDVLRELALIKARWRRAQQQHAARYGSAD